MNKIKVVIWLLVAILLIGIAYQIEYGNERFVTAKVSKTERITSFRGSNENRHSKSYYLIFTNKGTFRIQDQLLFGKFNSSDIYGSIKEGETYIFNLTGYRLPYLSMYPNVVNVYNGKR